MLIQNQMDASVVGIGQLITQRKRLRIPPHQREFSWTREVVQEFVKDVLRAADGGSPYFIGMVVLQGPSDSAWTVLDGQQRLVTVSLIYARIAAWLEAAGKSEDAKQLRDDFLQVRQLGGETGPRLRVSEDLSNVYNNLVLAPGHQSLPSSQSAPVEPGSSEQKLLEAVNVIDRFAVEWIEREPDGAGRAYRLATILERDVTVAALDVRDERSAFVIFETLNDRGITLTAWDLVRNHVLKECKPSDAETIKDLWRGILSNVAERDADDFLKVAWTASFGRVQRGDLFDRIRDRFVGPAGALELVSQLRTTSELYAAITRPDHPRWSRNQELRGLIGTLDILGNRQLRPAIISALESMSGSELTGLLEFFVDLLVRYQVVGRRRTGALEIGAARIARKIYTKEIRNRSDCAEDVHSLWVSDVEFVTDVRRFRDTKQQRVLYLAAALTCQRRVLPLELFSVPISETTLDAGSSMEGDYRIDLGGEYVPATADVANILEALGSQPLLASVRGHAGQAAGVWRNGP